MTAAAAAARKDFTLTIGFVPFFDAATKRPCVVERSEGSQEILKRPLTLTLNRIC